MIGHTTLEPVPRELGLYSFILIAHLGLVYPLTYTGVGLLGPYIKLVEWITYLHAAKQC